MFIYWILLFFSPIQTQFLVSSNQPIFRSNSSSARTTTTFANHSHIGLHFNPTNSIYTFNHDNGQIIISNNNSKSKQILYSNLSPSTQHPYSSHKSLITSLTLRLFYLFYRVSTYQISIPFSLSLEFEQVEQVS